MNKIVAAIVLTLPLIATLPKPASALEVFANQQAYRGNTQYVARYDQQRRTQRRMWVASHYEYRNHHRVFVPGHYVYR